MTISNVVVAYLCFLAAYWMLSGVIAYLLCHLIMAVTKTPKGVIEMSFWRFCAGGGLSIVALVMFYPTMTFHALERKI